MSAANNNTLEHVNITVSDAKRSAQMLCQLFDWSVRWEGPAKDAGHTIHVGTTDQYLAIYQNRRSVRLATPNGQSAGRLNHVGVVVNDLAAIEARVKQLGYKPFNHADYAPGKRFYFLDEDGIEFEIISYRSA